VAKKILVVEDEADVLRVVCFRLEKAGYQVICATDGQEAWVSIENEIPDLVLLDLRIPKIGGQDVCRRIKADGKLKSIPVILFTASADGIAEKTKEYCADDYLIKPFTQEDLLGKVKKFIG